MIKKIAVLLSVFGFGIAQANPFLTNDATCYDVSGADSSCPSEFQYSDDDGATWIRLDDEIGGTSIVIWQDLGHLNAEGHEWLIKSVNAWGESEFVPFDFGVGIPVGPTGLTVQSPPAD